MFKPRVMCKAVAFTLSMATFGVSQHALADTSAIDKPECVAPAKPGGGFDLTCRVAQTGLASEFDRPMQVTFMPGGVGAVAISLFNTTRTDDPNAIVAFSSGSLLNMATGKYGQFGEKDVRFVATAGADFGAVVVNADSEYETLDDLMAALEADVGSIALGAGGGVGSQDWMKGALLVKSRDLDPKAMRYVAFDGGGEAIAALLGGSIQAYMGDVGELVSYVGGDKLRVLAVMSPERLDAPFADVPTTSELGYDGAEWVILRGFYMGKDVPDEAYNAWADAFKAAYDTEEFAQIQKEKGLLPLNMAGEELQADVLKRVDRMRVVAKEAGLIQ